MQKTNVIVIDLRNLDAVDIGSFFDDRPIDHGAALGCVCVPNNP